MAQRASHTQRVWCARLLSWESAETFRAKLKVADAIEGFVPGETSLFQRVVVRALPLNKSTGIASSPGVLAFMYFQTTTADDATPVNGQDWLKRDVGC